MVQHCDGQLPLHYAIKHKEDSSVIKMLYEAYSDAICLQDENRYLPLHVACRYIATLYIIIKIP
jgi:ankyrin repeat protein